jgi:8-oxo-dGTP pyrophosphatase MutT (NUDIX family)
VQGGEEFVAVYDAHGAVVGSATRGEVRAKGLWHAASSVLVRSPDGESVYVHLRSPHKDVFPGTYDCWAGGVVAAGETPVECAYRELAEELGIRGVRLEPLFTHVFHEPPIRCHNFTFETRWDGPVTHQPEEIVAGRWLPLTELAQWADDPNGRLIPDGRQGIREWFRRYRSSEGAGREDRPGEA